MNYKARISTLRKLLIQRQESAALLVSSARPALRNRDTNYSYRQNSDFFYFTGCEDQDLALLISANHSRPILFAPEANPTLALWQGPTEDHRGLAKSLGADLVRSCYPIKEIRQKLCGHELLYYQSEPGTISSSVARELLELPGYERRAFPGSFTHADLLIEQLRLYKDPQEVQLIEEALSATFKALLLALPRLCSGSTEAELAATVHYGFSIQDCGEAFPAIVAAGRSAATLHHTPTTRRLKRGELVLFDIGAERCHYAADITRVFPVASRFSPWQRELYQIVLQAQKAALGTVRAGVPLATVHTAAARVLTEGLKDLKVLRGKTTVLQRQQAYKAYFPHGIGHSLGLDVHDVGPVRGNNEFVLQRGMVITVEPGLYFQKAAGILPACGVRIEDTVLVQNQSCKVLSRCIPKEPDDVEALLQF